MAKDTRKAVGTDGETRAASYLEQQGYTIVARNWRTRRGEIDIIVQKADVLVFVEVKTLPSGDAVTLAHELGKQKQKRISETAKCFLTNNRKYSKNYIRFDVVVIDMPGFDPIYHIENAFSGSL